MTNVLRNWSLSLCALAVFTLPAQPQTTLTGAIQFSTDVTGAGSTSSQIWNTLGGDNRYALWLALNPDASSPVNGPGDGKAGISIPLSPGNTYRYYTFTQPGSATFGFSGLNLFFDGHSTTPGISVYGPLNGIKFHPNNSSTLTLAAGPVQGSGTNFYSSGGVVVLVTEYNLNAPKTTDVCQAYQFAPGNGPDYFGSFTLQVFEAATLTSSPSIASPGAGIMLAGNGFSGGETVNIYFGTFSHVPFATVTADSSGTFSLTTRVPQTTYGPKGIYAAGQTSEKLGATSLSVQPDLAISPRFGARGSLAKAQGFGFGNNETVQVYWTTPNQLLGTVNTNASGSFFSGNALQFAIPENALPGINTLMAIGQTTQAVATGHITVK